MYRYLIIPIITLCMSLMQHNYVYAPPPIEKQPKAVVSDDLNIEDEQMQDLLDLLNNLSPEDQKQLEDLGKQLEEQMKEQKLDPNNPDDLLKWLEQAAPEDDKPKKEPKIDKEPSFKPEKTISCPVEITPETTDAKEAKRILRETVHTLTLIRQKVLKYEDLSYKLERFKLELNELTYFLNVLAQKDLIKHLISKDFVKLYKNIACIHDVLIMQEPNIIIEEIEVSDVEDPYEVLKIRHTAKQSEIEQVYENLKELFDPEKLSQKLQAQGITGKDLNKRIKEARISFKFIQNAYDLLKDARQRSIVDRSLKEKFDAEKKSRQSAQKALDRIVDTISSNILAVIKDTKQLLEKYKPEELKKAQEQEKREKEIAIHQERIKKYIPPTREFRPTPKRDYEEFYRQLAQEKAQREYRPYMPPPSRDKFPEKDERPKPEDKKAPAKPTDKKPTDKKPEKKDDKKAAPDKGKPGAPSTGSAPGPKDFEISFLIKNIGKLLDGTKDEIEVEKAGKKSKIKFKDAVTALDRYLSQPVTPEHKETVKNFIEFFKVNKISELAEELEKLSKEKITSPDLVNNWKDISKKHGKKINDWYNAVNPILDLRERHNKRKNTFAQKTNFHNLAVNDKDIKKDYAKHLADIKKKQPALQTVDYEEADLGSIKLKYKKIKDSFDKISKSTAAGPAKPAPAAGKPSGDNKAPTDKKSGDSKDKKDNNDA